MECDKVREKISEYFEGLVTAEEKALISAHIASCNKCRAAYSDIKKTVEHIKGLEEVEPPPWLTRKVMARVKEENPKQGIWKRLFYPLHIKLPLEAVATVLIAISALYLFRAAEQETKIAGLRPGGLEEQQLHKDSVLKEKGPETVDAEKKSVPAKNEDKTSPSGKTLSGPAKTDRAQEPGYDNLSPAIPQKESVGKDIPRAAPAPAPLPEEKEAPGAGMESPAESVTTNKQKATGIMKSAVPPEREKLRERPASAAATHKGEESASREDATYRKPIVLNLHVPNLDRANDEIREFLTRLGGRFSGSETARDRTVLTIEIDSGNIRELYKRLATVGKLSEKEPPSGIIAGTVRVKIEMVKTPDR